MMPSGSTMPGWDSLPFTGILDGRALHFDIVSALRTRVDAVEYDVVRDRIRSVYLWPRPSQRFPWPADLPAEQRLDRRALGLISALVEQEKRLAVALMNGPWPIRINRKTQAVEPHVAVSAAVDLPRPAALALPRGWTRIEVAGATPVAVTRDEHFSRELPLFGHRNPLTLQLPIYGRRAM